MAKSGVGDDHQQITKLLLAWREGEPAALDRLMPIVYDELKRLASAYMRRQKPGHSLQTVDLVNEAYMRLIDSSRVNWQDRNHFYAIASQIMRRLLVDSARKRNSQKRGGGRAQITLDDNLEVAGGAGTDIVALDEAMKRLAALNPRQSRIIELRYFGGLTEEETAEVLGLSSRTIRRDWTVARAWLFRELTGTLSP
ncbi:MAG TPA: sigma-70 family RNA polymerase sigma factor [Pyrinomonadaceae bacterium]|nr:sigma-70 family RNA polymerase sigma factor [Pyrinomonadaceae bacterium]